MDIIYSIQYRYWSFIISIIIVYLFYLFIVHTNLFFTKFLLLTEKYKQTPSPF